MNDNYDSGFDLVLSDHERMDLIAYYETMTAQMLEQDRTLWVDPVAVTEENDND